MRVHDRMHIGPYPIDFRMDVEFERRPGAALDEVAVEIDGDDVVGRQRAARGRGRIDVKRFVVAPCDLSRTAGPSPSAAATLSPIGRVLTDSGESSSGTSPRSAPWAYTTL